MKNERRMQQYSIRFLGSLILILWLRFSTATILAQEEGHIELTNISNGVTISELTVLKGTIDFPDFLKYEILLKSGNNRIWSGNSHSAVTNGNLARLDPRVFNDGEYQIIVRMVHLDSNYTDYSGPTIKIDNPANSAQPYYSEVEPSFLYPSQKFGIVRIRNCAGEDFNFDYSSPDGGRSSADTSLRGKTETSICTFEDIALIPGLYRGTGQGGGQDHGHPIEIQVDAGHVYEILYLGPSAGGQEVTAREVGADSLTGAATTGTGQSSSAAPKPAATATPKPQPAAPRQQPESMLPTTGDQSDLNLPGVAMGLILILILSVGGVMAVRHRSMLPQAAGRTNSRPPANRPE